MYIHQKEFLLKLFVDFPFNVRLLLKNTILSKYELTHTSYVRAPLYILRYQNWLFRNHDHFAGIIHIGLATQKYDDSA